MKTRSYLHRLQFKRPAGTSRGILDHKDSWFIELEHDGRTGLGECSVIPGLSPDIEHGLYDNIDELLTQYSQDPSTKESWDNYPALKFAIELAEKDLTQKADSNYYQGHLENHLSPIPINGLIWMGELDFMRTQIAKKIEEGFTCLKLKIAALDFEQELQLLKWIRKEFANDNLILRVDANGGFSCDSAMDKLKRLSEHDIHSIEQPIKAGQLDEMADLCSSTPIPIALDEELIGVTENQIPNLLDHIQPQYIILKPSLLGGIQKSMQWIKEAQAKNIDWWATSALESNIGLYAIARWVQTLGVSMYQGLGTGGLFTNNIDAPMIIKDGHLEFTRDPWRNFPFENAI